MKHSVNKLFATAIALILIGLAACNEDKGNYNYQDINRVDSILGIANSYPVYLGYQLKITPRLVYALGTDANEFTYKWYYYDNAWKLLQEGLDLDQEIAGDIGRNRTMAFEAYNEKTDIPYRKVFRIELPAPVGYMALCETEDGYDVDMVSYVSVDTIFALSRNVLEGIQSTIPRAGVKPIDIVTAGSNNNLAPLPTETDGTSYTIYILTDQYTTRLASKDLSWKPAYNIETTVEAGSYLDVNYVQKGKPVIAGKMRITDYLGCKVWFYHVNEEGEGNWFLYSIYPMVRYLCNPMNMEGEKGSDGRIWPKDGSRFEPLKEICAHGSTVATSATLWDKDNRRFMFACPHNNVSAYTFGDAYYSKPIDTETGTAPFSFTDSDYDDVVTMGEVFGSSITSIDGFAIIKLKSGGYCYIRFAGKSAPTTPWAAADRRTRSDFPASSAIGRAKFVAAYPQADIPFIYYVTDDNKVFKADISGIVSVETEITDLFVKDGYSEITAFKFLLPNTNGTGVFHGSELEKGLAVATYNASKGKAEGGKLEVFTLKSGSNSGELEMARYPTPKAVEEKPSLAAKQVAMSFTGMGKIVGLDYKKK
ncbi:MAG: hypothetical protein LBG18_00340 [Mediterranea sp.]|nr:hypothetical protein [Mediterranea sp.]